MSPVAAVVAVWLQNKVFPAYWIVPCFGHAGFPVFWGASRGIRPKCYCPLVPLQFWLSHDDFEHEIWCSHCVVFLIYHVCTGIYVCSPTFRWISRSPSSVCPEQWTALSTLHSTNDTNFTFLRNFGNYLQIRTASFSRFFFVHRFFLVHKFFLLSLCL